MYCQSVECEQEPCTMHTLSTELSLLIENYHAQMYDFAGRRESKPKTDEEEEEESEEEDPFRAETVNTTPEPFTVDMYEAKAAELRRHFYILNEKNKELIEMRTSIVQNVLNAPFPPRSSSSSAFPPRSSFASSFSSDADCSREKEEKKKDVDAYLLAICKMRAQDFLPSNLVQHTEVLSYEANKLLIEDTSEAEVWAQSFSFTISSPPKAEETSEESKKEEKSEKESEGEGEEDLEEDVSDKEQNIRIAFRLEGANGRIKNRLVVLITLYKTLSPIEMEAKKKKHLEEEEKKAEKRAEKKKQEEEAEIQRRREEEWDSRRGGDRSRCALRRDRYESRASRAREDRRDRKARRELSRGNIRSWESEESMSSETDEEKISEEQQDFSREQIRQWYASSTSVETQTTLKEGEYTIEVCLSVGSCEKYARSSSDDRWWRGRGGRSERPLLKVRPVWELEEWEAPLTRWRPNKKKIKIGFQGPPYSVCVMVQNLNTRQMEVFACLYKIKFEEKERQKQLPFFEEKYRLIASKFPSYFTPLLSLPQSLALSFLSLPQRTQGLETRWKKKGEYVSHILTLLLTFFYVAVTEIIMDFVGNQTEGVDQFIDEMKRHSKEDVNMSLTFPKTSSVSSLCLSTSLGHSNVDNFYGRGHESSTSIKLFANGQCWLRSTTKSYRKNTDYESVSVEVGTYEYVSSEKEQREDDTTTTTTTTTTIAAITTATASVSDITTKDDIISDPLASSTANIAKDGLFSFPNFSIPTSTANNDIFSALFSTAATFPPTTTTFPPPTTTFPPTTTTFPPIPKGPLSSSKNAVIENWNEPHIILSTTSIYSQHFTLGALRGHDRSQVFRKRALGDKEEDDCEYTGIRDGIFDLQNEVPNCVLNDGDFTERRMLVSSLKVKPVCAPSHWSDLSHLGEVSLNQQYEEPEFCVRLFPILTSNAQEHYPLFLSGASFGKLNIVGQGNDNDY